MPGPSWRISNPLLSGLQRPNLFAVPDHDGESQSTWGSEIGGFLGKNPEHNHRRFDRIASF